MPQIRYSIFVLCTLCAVLACTKAATISYDFEDATKIAGTAGDIVYTAPDLNSFGSGIRVGSLELSDGSTPSSDFGRFVDLGGGSFEAVVNDRSHNIVSFTVTIDSYVTVDFSAISFDTSMRFTNTGDSTAGWDFYTVVGEATGNEISSAGWTHDGASNYQSPGNAASGDVTLSGLTGLTGMHRPQQYLLHYPNGKKGWCRDGNWKLAYLYETDMHLLFNLEKDPTESTKLAPSEPERVVQMARAMARDLNSRWRRVDGADVTLWPVLDGSYTPRPGTDDPFFISYDVDGRDVVDSDGDGLADAQEDINSDGLVSILETDSDDRDTDDDGADDYTEARLNLDPLDAASSFALRLVPIDEGSIVLSWPSAPSLFFNIRASEDLSLPMTDWAILESNVVAHETLPQTSRNLPMDSEQLFYFVELLP